MNRHVTGGADKSLARPVRKQALKHVRDARDFNNIEMRTVIQYFFLQGKAPKEIHAIRTETLACLLPDGAKDLSALLYIATALKKVPSRYTNLLRLLYRVFCNRRVELQDFM